MKALISLEEALEIIELACITPLGKEKIVFSEALHRVIATDILAPCNDPKYNVSSMDAYAFSSKDIELLITEGLKLYPSDNPVGNLHEMVVEKGYALKSFTGANMPQNCDSLLIVEHAEVKNNRLFVKKGVALPKPNDFVRLSGQNYHQNDKLLTKGQKISAYGIGLLAQLNQVFVEVIRKPRVAILSTGNELIEVGQNTQNENATRSTNNHLLKALVESMGGVGVLYELINDDLHTLKEKMQVALLENDMLITTGGMSMGDYDFTQTALEELCEMRFKKVRIKPGKPVAFALYYQHERIKPVLALPGNPNASLMGFYLFGRVILNHLLQTTTTSPIIQAVLESPISRKDTRLEFRFCALKLKNGVWHASLEPSIYKNPSEHGVILLDEGVLEFEAQSVVKAMRFMDLT
ncbi:molybdopterin molybdotransferase MoeA [Helicobacter cetorum]|uniref:Molybdopterin molybdenumtransferase n=1 Tax=Helicobacter cetorum (strain ATCC BAA-540 / CCUG 52418 / MIT 99-5656) TaxID=1163745 RepID=I0ET65_HELCM|nr:molybdopterin molybdotransferase MoeA [Helicobacter cetorum]AFI06134.1 molybdopterin biosynthesis protein [Helicobacter cetorum MIT 99-5656]